MPAPGGNGDEHDSDRGDTRPVPDPTKLTDALVARAIASEREWALSQFEVVGERLHGIDVATVLRIEEIHTLQSTVDVQIDTKVGHLKELHDEKFGSVQQQFTERDTRSERESRDNKVAVDAAFAAQKEAASEQNKSNTLAIDKSEKATAETLNKQADLFKSTTDALADKVDDLKERVSELALLVNGVIQGGLGRRETVIDNRAGGEDRRAWIAISISAVLMVLTIVGFVIALTLKK